VSVIAIALSIVFVTYYKTSCSVSVSGSSVFPFISKLYRIDRGSSKISSSVAKFNIAVAIYLAW